MSATLLASAGVGGARTSIELQEQLDALDPLRHLASIEADHIVPAQQTSIIDQRAIVRYYKNGTDEPVTLGIEEAERPQGAQQVKASYVDVVLKLDVTEGCGGKIWPAAEVLGAYIASKRTKKDWEGKTVVELGSGTGLAGLLVAKLDLGCERIWITDQKAMLDLMAYNLSLNTELTSPCEVLELNWGEPLPSFVPSKPDVLLLADCVYLEVAFAPLVQAMLDLSTPTTEILFCYQKRRKADKRFFTLLRKHFLFTDVNDDDPIRTQAYRRQGTSLLKVTRKT